MAAAALASTSLASPTPSEEYRLAPLLTPPPPPQVDGPPGAMRPQSGDPKGHLVKDSYIVVLKKGLHEQQVEQHKRKVQQLWATESARAQKRGIHWGKTFEGLKHHYSIGKGSFRGYSAHIPKLVLTHIRALPEVAYVERDSIVTINDPYFTSASTTSMPVIEGESVAPSEIEVEYGAPWGLARISHRDRLKFGTINVYPYDAVAGEGVDVYVIDTGVNIKHLELEGRASWGKTIPQDVDEDSNGHGSHVAGTIASRAYGVAKKASIVAVKVLGAGGSGTMSDVVAGVAWAAESAEAVATAEAARKDSKHKGSVANMSLGGSKSRPLDEAVDSAVETGLHFAVAAGNDNRDACTFSPAAAANPITVGASTIQDERAYFSNHGKCVDIFAPGLNIKSIWNTGNQSINTISGTSMASPHIAGLAAYFLSLYPDKLDVASMLSEEATDVRSGGLFRQDRQLVFDRIRQGLGFGPLAPVPGKGLTPKQMKAVMLKLASKDVLADLPAETINALAFNNITA